MWNHGLYRKGNAVPVIIDSLSKLEYRGYDPRYCHVRGRKNTGVQKRKAGWQICLMSRPGTFISSGIGHTRWATHGVPSDLNAHPHCDCSGRIAVVHNGIIENYASLRKDLILEGHDFISDTDTEVMVHLIEKFYTGSLEEAVRKALTMIRGSFAMVAICSEEPDCIVTAKKDSPLIVGLGEGENYVASDIPAILGKTRQVYIMDENEFAVLTPRGVTVSDFEGKPVEKKAIEVDWDPIAAEKEAMSISCSRKFTSSPKPSGIPWPENSKTA